MIILGLAGPARSGKDTVADYLVRHYGFVKCAFSDTLYDEAQQAYGLEDQSLLRDAATKDTPSRDLALDQCSDGSFVSVARRMLVEAHPDTFFPLDEQPLSPRQVLQWWGTEYRRAQDPDYWIKRAEDRIMTTQSLYPEQRPQHFVETGTRFENERSWIHDHGGNVWHIRRDCNNAPGQGHASSATLPVWDLNMRRERELWNNDSLDRLYQGIDLLMSTSARFVRVEPMDVRISGTCTAEEFETYGRKHL